MGLPDKFLGQEPEQEEVPQPLGFKERVYEKLRMPLWVLDLIIALLFAALATALILGLS